jgi:hypothetical protein
MAFRLDDTCGGRCEMRVSSKSDGGRFTKEGSARRNIIAVLEEGATTTSVQRKNGLNRQALKVRFVIERLDWLGATDAATRLLVAIGPKSALPGTA